MLTHKGENLRDGGRSPRWIWLVAVRRNTSASTLLAGFYFFVEGIVKRTHVASAVTLLALWLSCPSQMMAQGLFGTISGTVIDSQGAVVSGASVKGTNAETNVSKRLTTNSACIYSADSLNPGTYRVEAGASGFKTAVAEDIVLGVSANAKVNLTLSPGA